MASVGLDNFRAGPGLRGFWVIIMKKRILVTGANGFVGNHVVAELLNQNYEVIATSRNPEKAELCKWYPQVSYIPCDLNVTQKDFFEFFQQPDLLIHLAWEGLPNYKGLFHLERNLLSNYRFLRNMIEQGLRHLIVTGTCLEYGMQEGCLTESNETRPITPYGLAKDTLRRFLQALQHEKPFVLQWARLFYMCGPGQNPNSLLPQLDRAIDSGDESFNMSGGEQLRDYLPVTEVAARLVSLAEHPELSQMINICSGTPISVRRLAENHIAKRNANITLNLGHYPYPDYEPMEFWGASTLEYPLEQPQHKLGVSR